MDESTIDSALRPLLLADDDSECDSVVGCEFGCRCQEEII